LIKLPRLSSIKCSKIKVISGLAPKPKFIKPTTEIILLPSNI